MSRKIVDLTNWYLTRAGQVVDLHEVSKSGIFTFPVKGRILRRTTRGGWVGRFGAWSVRGKNSAAPIVAHCDDLVEVTRQEYVNAQSKAPKNTQR